MKCIPIKFCGFEWAAASFVILILEVFEAKIDVGDKMGDNDLIMFTFKSKSSLTA
jgi:hypothetical protein